ncbi:unnamed protein product [Ceutorhynchus assimilis]|uniref:Uncharacterized protein n=1 Tax=Ceutorhynchus assimilis TaxID=467358 RepID=A0A9N9MLP2_9CUCU|nr:unnamed protein product [Ceutorhynchus assimilis]
MGRAISKIKHPFRDFNVESRAQKVISQPTPKPAPKHLKDALDLKRMKEAFPEVFEESLKKNETLDKHLKDVFVTRTDVPFQPQQPINPSRPLPQDKSQPEQFLFGHKEPDDDKIPLGKTTLRNTLKFISQHQKDPTKYDADFIAKEHKLPKEIVEKILLYYRVFEMYVPEYAEHTTKAKFAGPSVPKKFVLKDVGRKYLGPPKHKDNT